MTKHLPTILVVEDEKSLLEAWVDRFRQERLNVLAARDGKSALLLALKLRPDLIVVDLVMPSADGLVLIKKLREDKWGCRVPVMFLSAWLNAGGADGLAEAGRPPNNNWNLEKVMEQVRIKLK